MSSKPLDQRPIHTQYNTSYHRKKTADGFSIDAAYLKRFYSSIDAEIYFGNEFVEDVTYIDWNVVQNVTPLFGYNSYTYDEVARGNRIIHGVFDINFSSPNYLFKLLEAAKGDSITDMKSYTVSIPENSIASINKNLSGTIDMNPIGPIWEQTFDIDIIFGQKTGVGDPVHILLEGVAIQQCHTALSGNAAESPSSVRERYEFIAKDIKTVS